MEEFYVVEPFVMMEYIHVLEVLVMNVILHHDDFGDYSHNSIHSS